MVTPALVTSCQQFIPIHFDSFRIIRIHFDSWNSCFWFVKKQGVLGQQQNAQGTNTYDTMNEIFKEDGIFDNLPSVSSLQKNHFCYQDFTIVQLTWPHMVVAGDCLYMNSWFWTTVVEEFFKLGFQVWVNKLMYF